MNKNLKVKIFIVIVMELFLGLLLFLIQQGITYAESPKDMPVVTLHDIEKIYLEVYKVFGTIKGYIVFIDKEGRMCAVDSPTWTGKLKMGSSWEKEVKIRSSEFTYITTKGGDTLLALPLEPFIELDDKGEVIGVEIINASKILKPIAKPLYHHTQMA